MSEEIAGTFGALAMIYDVISRLFANALDQGMAESLEFMDEDVNLLLNPDDPDWTEGLCQIASYCRGNDIAKVLQAIGDHSQLFVGPGHLPAPPWASVYLDQGMMFGASTLKVADMYKRFGLTVPRPGTEPDDHIAFELGFVAVLNQKLQAAIEAGDHGQAAEMLQALSGFVNDHMAVWLEPFLCRVEEHAETDFYRGLARVTRALTSLERRFLSQLTVELADAREGVGSE